jgi:hypothetical protein
VEYLTAKEVSERWRGSITVGTLKQWRWLQKGPRFVRFGNKILYRLVDIEEYESNQTKRGKQ